MIQLDSLTLMLLIEALAGLVLAAATGLWIVLRRRRRERHAVADLIDQLRRSTGSRAQAIGAILEEIRALPEEKRQLLTEETVRRERALCKHVLQSFLQRDVAQLRQLESHLGSLAEPYHQCLRAMPRAEDPSLTRALAEARSALARLQAENDQLADQLQAALKTIDRLSLEYSRMFAPDRTSADFNASRTKILDTLRALAERLAKPDGRTADTAIPVTDNTS